MIEHLRFFIRPDDTATACRARLAAVPAIASLSLASLSLATLTAVAQPGPVPDRLTATTTDAMVPSGLELRFDINEWSSAEERSAIVSALQMHTAALAEEEEEEDGSDEEIAELDDFPTIGYVWTGGSAVGYSIKYAHREPQDGGGEKVIFVTTDRIGRYGLQTWQLQGAEEGAGLPIDFTVFELSVDEEGSGDGSLSLTGTLQFDAEAGRLTLMPTPSVPALLEDVSFEPKPYWAEESQ